MLAPIEHRIAIELNVRPAQVNAAIALLDDDPGLIRHPELAHLVSALIDDEQAAFLERG